MLRNIDYLHLINKTYHFKNISLRIDKSWVVYVRFAEVARTIWLPFSNITFKNLNVIRIFHLKGNNFPYFSRKKLQRVYTKFICIYAVSTKVCLRPQVVFYFSCIKDIIYYIIRNVSLESVKQSTVKV